MLMHSRIHYLVEIELKLRLAEFETEIARAHQAFNMLHQLV